MNLDPKIPYPWPMLNGMARDDGADLTLIVGLPGAYKTWLALAVARHVRQQGFGIALASRDGIQTAWAGKSPYFPSCMGVNTMLLLVWADIASGIDVDSYFRGEKEPPVALLVADAAQPDDLGWLSDLAQTKKIAVLATMTTKRQMPGKHQKLPRRTIRVTGPLPRSGRLFLDCDMPECRLGFELAVERHPDGPEFSVVGDTRGDGSW